MGLKSEKLRKCLHYNVNVNAKVNIKSYTLPGIETLLSKISGAKYFAKIDLAIAYWQIALDEKSQEICMNSEDFPVLPAYIRDQKMLRSYFNKLW